MFDLSGQKALVTGASGDIGSAIAKALHLQGCELIISGTNEAKLNELAKKLHGEPEIKICNLSNAQECNSLIEDLGKIDILVCNAGISKDSLAIRMSEQDFDDVINVNLKASFILNKAALKKMIRQRHGRIINISSVVAFAGNPGQANYCASKAGLVGMTKSLALEASSRNITINCIAPGFIQTNMTDKLTEKQKEDILSKIPMKQYGTPEDIASAVVYLSSSEAKYITGQTFHVNGGMLMV